jgi:Tfp pilus assembly protein PilF
MKQTTNGRTWIGWLAVLLLCGAAMADDDRATLEGRLLDTTGTPISSQEIELTPTDYHGERAFTTTDEDGRFRLELKPASYRVKFRRTDREVRLLDATGVVGGTDVAWEISAAFEPGEAPPLVAGPGEEIRYEAVLAAPGEELDVDTDGYRGTLDRLTDLVYAGNCADAAGQLEAHLESFPHRAKGHYLLGYCRATMGHTEEGVASLERALELNDSMPGAALLLAQVLLQSGKADEAVPWLRSEAQNGSDPNIRAQAWMSLGILERDRGNGAEAIAAFEGMVAEAPGRPEPYAELANLHAAAGDAEKLLDAMARGRAVGPVDLGPLLNHAISRMNERDYEQARGMLGKALELSAGNEDRAMVHALIGRCQLGQEQRSAGIASLKKSLELDGDGRFAAECRKILSEVDG